jgi:hypothetical protein
VYYVVKTPPGITNRDFLLERKIRIDKQEKPEKYLIHYRSINPEDELNS